MQWQGTEAVRSGRFVSGDSLLAGLVTKGSAGDLGQQ